jgi:hypothetical protein
MLLRTAAAYVEDSAGRWKRLETVPVAAAGFGADEGLIHADRTSSSFQLLAEYFAFPGAQTASFTKLGVSTLTFGDKKATFELVNHEPASDTDKSNAGDGTVPLPSGKLIAECSPQPKAFSMTGFDHQMSYGNLRVQENVLYSIAKIVQLATPVAELPQCKE